MSEVVVCLYVRTPFPLPCVCMCVCVCVCFSKKKKKKKSKRFATPFLKNIYDRFSSSYLTNLLHVLSQHQPLLFILKSFLIYVGHLSIQNNGHISFNFDTLKKHVANSFSLQKSYYTFRMHFVK